MIVVRVFCCLAALVFLGASSQEAPNPSHDTGYPKPGTKAGEIDVKGTLSLDADWTTVGGGAILAWPVGGGIVQTVDLKIPDDSAELVNWGGTIGELATGEEYWVLAQIDVKKGEKKEIFRTAPVKVKAK